MKDEPTPGNATLWIWSTTAGASSAKLKEWPILGSAPRMDKVARPGIDR
jgi:hypothetical protein